MKFKYLLLFLCLVFPLTLIGCENKTKDVLYAPNNLTVEDNGHIIFERVQNEQYYTISINDFEFNVFPNYNENVLLFTKNKTNYLRYDASDIFTVGEDYTVKVKSKADNKIDSDYTAPVSYTHKLELDAVKNIKINNHLLTWDTVENASLYHVKVVYPGTTNLDSGSCFNFTTNRFDFSSLLSKAGKYKFYITASSNNPYYLNSATSKAVDYTNIVEIHQPENLSVAKLIDGTLHLTCMVDENANSIKINCNNYTKTVQLNNADLSVVKIGNLIDVNLTEYFKNVMFNDQVLNFDSIENFDISIQAIYESFNEEENFYIDSIVSEIYTFAKTQKLSSLNVVATPENQSIVLNWQNVNNGFLAGYKVYCFENDFTTYILDSTATSFTLPINTKFAYIQALGKGNYLDSMLSVAYSENNSVINNLNVNIENNNLVWTNIENANYIVEINNLTIFTQSNSLDLSTLDSVANSVTITAQLQGYAPKTITKYINYSKQISTPNILGLYENGYVLKFTKVENALGYKIYFTKGQNTVSLDSIFSNTTVDLTNYILKQTDYADYEIQVQAIANPYCGYSDSELSDSITISHNKVLNSPLFANTAISKETIDGKENYYVNFYGVDGASKYEILINHHLIKVDTESIGYVGAYKINITDFLTEANKYTITIKALPEDNALNIIASEQNKTEFIITKQLETVSNVRIDVNQELSTYTLKFDLLENADSYLITINNLSNNNYSNYLHSLGLTNTFTVKSSINNITKYLRLAGNYQVKITALGSHSGYYANSMESSQNLTKLESLDVPTFTSNNIIDNIDKNTMNLSFTTVDNADYYIVCVCDKFGNVLKQYETTFTTINLNEVFTKENDYYIKVRAMVNASGENNNQYLSSEFSNLITYNYTFTNKHDFERNPVFMYGENQTYIVSDATDLKNILWYHYLYEIDENIDLKVYFEQQENETLTEQIKRIATQFTTSNIYNFNSDENWISLKNSNESTNTILLNYVVEKILSIYPELAVLTDLNVEFVENNIFKIYYKNSLGVEKIDTPNAFINILNTNYGNAFNNLSISQNKTFAIDSYDFFDVSTSEQLLYAVMYGKQPNFVGNSTIAETIYTNAKTVLNNILTNDMTDSEKATRIFDWLQYGFNLNLGAKNKAVGEIGTIAEYGNRKEFYLEGIFLDLVIENGSFNFSSGNATAESFSKAFALLCGIEGIETNLVHGSINNPYLGQISHTWNKICIDENWYNVDLTYSDYFYKDFDASARYNQSSHLFFLVSDNFMQTELGATEFSYTKNENQNAIINYNYYANKTFGLTDEEIINVSNIDRISYDTATYGEIVGFEYSLTYDNTATYQAYDSGYSNLQAYVFNIMLYAKQIKSQNNGFATIEFVVPNGASINLNTIKNNINNNYSNNNNDNSADDKINIISSNYAVDGYNTLYIINVN